MTKFPVRLRIRRDGDKLDLSTITTINRGIEHATHTTAKITASALSSRGEPTLTVESPLGLAKAAFNTGAATVSQPTGATTLTFRHDGSIHVESDATLSRKGAAARGPLERLLSGDALRARSIGDLPAARSSGTLRFDR